jgi:hypothetical protein
MFGGSDVRKHLFRPSQDEIVGRGAYVAEDAPGLTQREKRLLASLSYSYACDSPAGLVIVRPGERPSTPKVSAKPCECGCGQLAKPHRRFLMGHYVGSETWRRDRERRKVESPPRLCACGCGKLVSAPWSYLPGHYRPLPQAIEASRSAWPWFVPFTSEPVPPVPPDFNFTFDTLTTELRLEGPNVFAPGPQIALVIRPLGGNIWISYGPICSRTTELPIAERSRPGLLFVPWTGKLRDFPLALRRPQLMALHNIPRGDQGPLR